VFSNPKDRLDDAMADANLGIKRLYNKVGYVLARRAGGQIIDGSIANMLSGYYQHNFKVYADKNIFNRLFYYFLSLILKSVRRS
jgi:hypothetical protein